MEKPKSAKEELCDSLAVVALFSVYFVGVFTILDTKDWTFIVIAFVLNVIAICYIKYVAKGKVEKLKERIEELEAELFNYKYHDCTHYDYKTIIVGITPGVHSHKDELEKSDNNLNTYLNNGYMIFREQEYRTDQACFYFMVLRKAK